MGRAAIITGCLALLALSATAAARELAPGSGGISFKPLMPQPGASALPVTAPSPYAMTYAEQVARRLGVDERGLALARPERGNPYAPAVSFNGSVLRLRWQP